MDLHFINHTFSPILFLKSDTIDGLIIAAILAFVVLVTLRRDKVKLLDMHATNQMKGLAILFVILCHYIGILTKNPFSQFFSVFANFGVGTFLILSGYGMTRSFLLKGITRHYYIRHIWRVYCPYMLSLFFIMFLNWKIYSSMYSVKTLILNFAGLQINPFVSMNGAYWFITYILIQYIFFFAVIRQKNLPMYGKVLAVGVANSALLIPGAILFRHGFYYIFEWAFYTLSFPFGMLIGYKHPAFEDLFRKLPRKQLVFGLGSLLFICLVSAFSNTGVAAFTPVVTAMTGTLEGVIIILSVVILLGIFPVYSRFLGMLGILSYELYLVHNTLLFSFDTILYHRPYPLSFFIFLAIIILLSFALKWLSNLLTEAILFLWHLGERQNISLLTQKKLS